MYTAIDFNHVRSTIQIKTKKFCLHEFLYLIYGNIFASRFTYCSDWTVKTPEHTWADSQTGLESEKFFECKVTLTIVMSRKAISSSIQGRF
ncbi:hypothetical protein GDO81_013486 [Engystomops pustulosus]|uniref:Uncharacterized protein n=1 Tax=Engystomops pustulosus TaxID=76066 RepID=A0AAV7AZS8_ENGPU|nr:hypothetical protein GDO81_013486 [Engystomops pustulosus]